MQGGISGLTAMELKNQTELIGQYVKLMMNQVKSVSDSLTTQELNVVIGLVSDIAAL